MAFGFRGPIIGLPPVRYGTAQGGGDGPADTPDPIPNSEVKRRGGENTLRGKIARRRFFYKLKKFFLNFSSTGHEIQNADKMGCLALFLTFFLF
jgi:hypothetical protein